MNRAVFAPMPTRRPTRVNALPVAAAVSAKANNSAKRNNATKNNNGAKTNRVSYPPTMSRKRGGKKRSTRRFSRR